MATDILYNVKNEVRKLNKSGTQNGNISERKLLFKCFLNGNDDMAKSHDLLVMLG